MCIADPASTRSVFFWHFRPDHTMELPLWHSSNSPASARTCGPHALKRIKTAQTGSEHYTANLYAKFGSSPAIDQSHPGCSLTDGEVIASPSGKESPRGVFGPKSCAQCGITKTPLWRNGPPGPKVRKAVSRSLILLHLIHTAWTISLVS